MPIPVPDPHFVGVDLAKATFAAAIPGLKSRTFPHTLAGLKLLLAWVRRSFPQGELHIVAESSGVYSRFFAFHLQYLPQVSVSIVDPGRVRHHAKSRGIYTKTDHIDAQVVLEYARSIQPRPFLHPSQLQAELSSLHHELACLDRDLRRIGNRLEAQAYLPQAHPAVRESLELQREQLAAERKRLLAVVQELLASDLELKIQYDLLLTIPGIGPAGARVLLSLARALITLSPKQLAQFAGLAPSLHESGTSVRGKSTLTRRGHPVLRQALYMCALAASRFHPLLREDYKRWRAAGKPHKTALIAVARKLLLLAQAVLISGKPYDPTRGLEKP